MRRLCIVLTVLFLMATFISTAYAQGAVEVANSNFKEVRKVYIRAKEELSDAQIDAIWAIEKAYKAALKELHKAELARDARIDRSPWK